VTRIIEYMMKGSEWRIPSLSVVEPKSRPMVERKTHMKCIKCKAKCVNLVLGENVKLHEILSM
jgi:hypothetical protein